MKKTYILINTNCKVPNFEIENIKVVEGKSKKDVLIAEQQKVKTQQGKSFDEEVYELYETNEEPFLGYGDTNILISLQEGDNLYNEIASGNCCDSKFNKKWFKFVESILY